MITTAVSRNHTTKNVANDQLCLQSSIRHEIVRIYTLIYNNKLTPKELETY